MDDKSFKQLIDYIKAGKGPCPEGNLTEKQHKKLVTVERSRIWLKIIDAMNKRDWSRYLLYFQSHERLYGFMQIQELLSDKEYFKYLGETITGLDNFWRFQNITIKLLNSRDKKYQGYLMNNAERKHLASLPNTLIIYRGCNQANQRGLSWTLSHEVAERFTKFLKAGDPKQLCRLVATIKQTEKFNKGKTFILKGECKKKDAICYFNGRNEEEILIEPKNVAVTTRREVNSDTQS
jgi:hypothetical protein